MPIKTVLKMSSSSLQTENPENVRQSWRPDPLKNPPETSKKKAGTEESVTETDENIAEIVSRTIDSSMKKALEKIDRRMDQKLDHFMDRIFNYLEKDLELSDEAKKSLKETETPANQHISHEDMKKEFLKSKA